MLSRFLLKRIMCRMIQTSVRNHISETDECLLICGLSVALTILCAHNIANGVIHEGGMIIETDSLCVVFVFR